MPQATDTEEHHKAVAKAFAEAVQCGERPTPESGNIVHHLSVLNELAKGHSLLACKHYAASNEIPWGRFGSLDSLRTVILMAPMGGSADVEDFPAGSIASDYVTFANARAEKVLFVFTGASHQFGAPLRLIHQWFRRLDASLVYIFDVGWTYYLGPVRGLGDSVDQTAASLDGIVKKLGGTSCSCAGISGGGFGALLFSMRLQARRALVFSPPTVIRESMPRVRQKASNLEGLLSADDCIDLKAVYARSVSVPPTRIYFPGNNEHDRHEASNLAGIPGVELIPVEYASHNLVPMFIKEKLFSPALEWLVA